MEKLPLIKLTIDPNDERSGVEFVSFVDRPAIERQWQAFADEGKPLKFAVTSEPLRIVSGPMMVAGMPIYRRSEQVGEYYVQFDADAIREIVYKYFKNARTVTANVMHKSEVDGVFMFESWLTDTAKPAPVGFESLPDGSWFGSFKVDNDEVWAKVVDGTFTGFSVEGIFLEAEQLEIDRAIVDEVVAALCKE